MKKKELFIILVGKLYLKGYNLTIDKPEHDFISDMIFTTDALSAESFKNIKSAISMKRILCSELHIDPKEVEICII